MATAINTPLTLEFIHKLGCTSNPLYSEISIAYRIVLVNFCLKPVGWRVEMLYFKFVIYFLTDALRTPLKK